MAAPSRKKLTAKSPAQAAKNPAPKDRAIRYTSRVRSFETEGGMKYLEVPRTVFNELGGKFLTRLICTIPKGSLEFHCGLMSAGNGRACIFISKEKLKQADLKVGEAVKITLKLDRSKYGMKMPSELAEILKQDAAVRKRFENLTPGKQRNIIFHVSSVKDAERRVNRAVQVTSDLLEMPEGKESMHVLLNPSLKNSVVAVTSLAQDAEFRSRFLPIEATRIVGTIVSSSAQRRRKKGAGSSQ